MARKATTKVRYPRFDPRDWRAVDGFLNLPSDAELRRFAKQMDAQHQGKPSTVILAPDYRLKGLWCERHFARVMQIPMPLRLKPHGNRREGFRLSNGATVDVIGRAPAGGAIYPDMTLRVDRKFHVDLLVLICFNGWDWEPEIVGWQPEPYVTTEGYRDTLRSGVESFVVSWRDLRSVSELAAVHAPNHPLAGTEDRPFYWNEGRGEVTTPAQEIAPDVTQESLFG